MLLLLQVWLFFSQTFFLNVHCDSPHNSCLYEFWKFNFFLKNRLKCSLHGAQSDGKFQNTTPPTVMILFQPNFFWNFPATVLIQVTYWDFEISNFIFFKILKLNIVPNGKISKRYCSYSYDSLSAKLFLNLHCDSLHKIAYRRFENLNGFLKKKLKFSLTWGHMRVKTS